MNQSMHSSRMRTARSSSRRGRVYLVPGGVPGLEGSVCSGGCLLWGVSALGGVCSWGCTWSCGVCTLSGGCTWSWRVSALGGVCSRGVSALGGCVPGPRGVPGLGRVCSRGVPGQRGVSAPGGVPGQVLPPPVDRYTPVNILPCPKLRLRAVKML